MEFIKLQILDFLFFIKELNLIKKDRVLLNICQFKNLQKQIMLQVQKVMFIQWE